MAGCFGNSPFDRAMEQQLNQYLDSCEEGFSEDQLMWANDTPVCPRCGKEIKL